MNRVRVTRVLMSSLVLLVSRMADTTVEAAGVRGHRIGDMEVTRTRIIRDDVTTATECVCVCVFYMGLCSETKIEFLFNEFFINIL